MHAFLTASPPKLEGKNNPDTLHIYPDVSIGITEIRSLQSFLARKPIQSPRHTVIIHDAHLLTLPAQQAFLKTLEEPPGNSQIYLVTAQPDSLLPTILSRVQFLDASLPRRVGDKDLAKTAALIHRLLPSSLGERLALLDAAAFDRESALQFLADLEQLLHRDLKLPVSYELISQTRTYLQANVNARLAMDNFAIQL